MRGARNKDRVIEETFIKLVITLTKEGVDMRLSHGKNGLVAWFENGFYKSDGVTKLQIEDGRLYLFARYEEKTAITSIDDIIRCSVRWYIFSCDRHSSWRTPPDNWKRLYKRIDVNRKGGV